MAAAQILIDEKNTLFDKTGMFYKKFPSDFRQIRYYTLLIVEKAPAEMKQIYLLEQQISELIKNAVKHGNKSNPEKFVECWFRFEDDMAHLVIQDEGKGFKHLEKWNEFNLERTRCLQERDFDALEQYVSFTSPDSDMTDNGNALFAAVQFWNGGLVFNKKRNAVAVMKKYHHNKPWRHLEDD